ncbi:septum formation initiator family protein [Lacihabitans sp. LS3-19]|uniref:FtsB family cell division protein n=1 Tax=Lacihabitans sp. LS3-19 TaxID=2487335 RepID=UPI0020CB7EE7|nr:septum formation initiator family protein [Lacihabitans sp. LS3-19]MCP9767731.1 septum formation initiator family protein [Lacihabitans sp. LS3-19]
MKKISSPFIVKYRFYIISSVIMLIWLIFFDRSNLIKQFDMAMELRQLETQKVFFEKQLEDIKKEEKEVLGTYSSLEKYAREKYLMKKDGETVFVLVDEDDKPIVEED